MRARDGGVVAVGGDGSETGRRRRENKRNKEESNNIISLQNLKSNWINVVVYFPDETTKLQLWYMFMYISFVVQNVHLYPNLHL